MDYLFQADLFQDYFFLPILQVIYLVSSNPEQSSWVIRLCGAAVSHVKLIALVTIECF